MQNLNDMSSELNNAQEFELWNQAGIQTTVVSLKVKAINQHKCDN